MFIFSKECTKFLLLVFIVYKEFSAVIKFDRAFLVLGLQ